MRTKELIDLSPEILISRLREYITKYNLSSKTGEYKETANKVLKKLHQLGYEVKGLDKYLERKTLVNKKEAEKYIDKLLEEKNKK